MANASEWRQHARRVVEGRLLAAVESGEATPMTAADWDDIKALVLDSLREEIREGLNSGPAQPLDLEAIKAEARKRLSKSK